MSEHDKAATDLPDAAAEPKFRIGQLVRHQRFDYRGVVIDVHDSFARADDWSDLMDASDLEGEDHGDGSREQPWYRVLVHDSDHETYVAEHHLVPDPSRAPVVHPLIEEAFDELVDGHYARTKDLN